MSKNLSSTNTNFAVYRHLQLITHVGPKIFLLNTRKCGLQFGFRVCTMYISQADNLHPLLQLSVSIVNVHADNIRKSRHIFSNTHAYANSQKHTLHIRFLLSTSQTSPTFQPVSSLDTSRPSL